jgi:type III secretion protein L
MRAAHANCAFNSWPDWTPHGFPPSPRPADAQVHACGHAASPHRIGQPRGARGRHRRLAQAAFEEERQRGYADGMAEAQMEQAEKMIETVSRTVDYFSKVETDMVALVMSAVRKIIDGYDDADRVLIVVKNALSVVRNQKQMTLRLHPQQVDTVRARVNDLLAAYPGVGYLDIVPDGRLGMEACILESEIGLVEASIDGQIAALQGAFQKVLGSRI